EDEDELDDACISLPSIPRPKTIPKAYTEEQFDDEEFELFDVHGTKAQIRRLSAKIVSPSQHAIQNRNFEAVFSTTKSYKPVSPKKKASDTENEKTEEGTNEMELLKLGEPLLLCSSLSVPQLKSVAFAVKHQHHNQNSNDSLADNQKGTESCQDINNHRKLKAEGSKMNLDYDSKRTFIFPNKEYLEIGDGSF
ncbi:hypothetical protein RFI_09502, partial [Reticulomyxa filosa]